MIAVRRLAFPAVAGVACLAMMAPSGSGCSSSSGTNTGLGLSGVVEESPHGTQVNGKYRYNGDQGPANIIGDLQRKTSRLAGKWTDEGSPSAASSNGGPAGGQTDAVNDQGLWRLKVTITNKDTGEVIGHWYSPARWSSLSS